jgi:hypothetical protein
VIRLLVVDLVLDPLHTLLDGHVRKRNLDAQWIELVLDACRVRATVAIDGGGE